VVDYLVEANLRFGVVCLSVGVFLGDRGNGRRHWGERGCCSLCRLLVLLGRVGAIAGC
jgi:hypothetical protein